MTKIPIFQEEAENPKKENYLYKSHNKLVKESKLDLEPDILLLWLPAASDTHGRGYARESLSRGCSQYQDITYLCKVWVEKGLDENVRQIQISGKPWTALDT